MTLGKNSNDNELPIEDIVGRVVTLLNHIATFWSNSRGWSPNDAAEMLAKSRLDRLASMAETLNRWVEVPPEKISDGDLIMAWTNLGSLLEGSLKLFLCVYLDDYKRDIKIKNHTLAFHRKKELLLDPDGLRMDVLIKCFEQIEVLNGDQLKLTKQIQARRNSIHVFKDFDIGTGVDFQAAVREYRRLLLSLNSLLPYPDEVAEPWRI